MHFNCTLLKVDEWIVLLCSESFFGSHGHSESLEQGCKHRPFSGTGKIRADHITFTNEI